MGVVQVRNLELQVLSILQRVVGVLRTVSMVRSGVLVKITISCWWDLWIGWGCCRSALILRIIGRWLVVGWNRFSELLLEEVC